MLQVFTMFFIVYEASKALFSEKYISVFLGMKSSSELVEQDKNNKESVRKLLSPAFCALLFTEVAYMIFTLSLLFTSYWFVGLLLLVLAGAYRKKLSPKQMVSDSIISIVVLLLVFIA